MELLQERGLAFTIKKDEFPVRIEFENTVSVEDYIQWYQSNKEMLSSYMLEKGGVLINGIDITSLEKFTTVMDATTEKFLDYVDGNSPRTKLSGKVYTSTEYDKKFSITLHNELSYSHRYPSNIYFCCIIAAPVGGETPIADCREVLKAMDPELVKAVKERKVKYIRNLHGGKGMGPSWQDTFETTDKDAVEKFCKETQTEFEWKADGGIKLIQLRDGVISHPVTGEEVWFNQIDQFHPSHLDPDIYEIMMVLYAGKEDELPMNVTFGDDTPVTAEMVKLIGATVDNTAVAKRWQQGDLLLLDNILVSHGRKPYEGDRKVLVSMS